ncbi:MAG: AAA family ATPase [Clostridia bacterium]|nr:AAA family ATPase [Clostridia bacterium]
MKLLSCYVSSFGRLKDFKYDFNAGLNVFNYENGWGKTTFATFIKAMFYGLSGDRTRSVKDNERTKFKPFNSTGLFGGYLDFEKDNKQFRIERFFGNKETEDTCKLIDLTTGKEYVNNVNYGNKLFGIDEEGFLSTTYFSQKDLESKSNASLTAKFNEITEIEDFANFENVLFNVEEQAKIYKYRGNKGLIADVNEEIFALNEKIKQCENASENIKNFNKEIEVLETETNVIKEEIDKISKLQKEVSLKEEYMFKKEQCSKIKEKIALLNEKLNSAKELLNGQEVCVDEVDAYLGCVKDLIEVQSKIKSTTESITLLEKTIENANKTLPKKPILPSFILGGATLIFALLSFVWIFSLIFSGVFAIFFATYLIYSNASNKNVNKNNSNTSITESINKVKEDLNSLLKIESKYLEKINSFISKFNLPKTDYYSFFNNLKNVINLKESVCKDIKENEKLLLELNFVENNNLENLSLQEGFSYQQKIKEKMVELQNKSSKISYVKNALERAESTELELAEYIVKKNQLLEKLNEYNERYRILNLTLQFLNFANETLKTKYREPLLLNFNKYVNKIINKEDIKATVDIDFKVTALQNGITKDVNYYSKGLLNSFEICKRFALIEVLFNKEKPFIVLDDPFTNLDEEKIKEALNVLKELSKEYQIIYFICHDSRALI